MMLRARMHALLAQSGQELSPWLLVAAAGFVVLVALLVVPPIVRRKNGASKPASSKTAPPQSSSASLSMSSSSSNLPALSGSASGEHRAIERDIQDLMREFTEMTKRATAQFDARAARLEALIREADQRLAKLTNAMEASSSREAIAPTKDAATVVTSSATTTPPDDTIDPRHVEIYTLCEQGLSVPQIADRLHRPSGEVELIIALRPRGKRAQAMSTTET